MAKLNSCNSSLQTKVLDQWSRDWTVYTEKINVDHFEKVVWTLLREKGGEPLEVRPLEREMCCRVASVVAFRRVLKCTGHSICQLRYNLWSICHTSQAYEEIISLFNSSATSLRWSHCTNAKHFVQPLNC